MVATENGVVERRREGVGRVRRGIEKKKCKKMKKRSSLQRLFVACRDVFKGLGTVPQPTDVTKLCHILDNMRPEDVGLSKDIPFFKAKRAAKGIPKVTCATVYKCEEFSLCIFFLPPRAVIPLHNHPGMTVFSKLLLGSMHIKSYDWVDPVGSDSSSPPSKLRLARLKADSVFTAPCNTSVLYPTSGGNIHAFTAITPCAVLDVLGPPYSKKDGRDCSYYKDSPYTPFSNGEARTRKEEDGEEEERYGWLEEVEMPEDSKMDWTEYLGPQIIDTSC